MTYYFGKGVWGKVKILGNNSLLFKLLLKPWENVGQLQRPAILIRHHHQLAVYHPPLFFCLKPLHLPKPHTKIHLWRDIAHINNNIAQLDGGHIIAQIQCSLQYNSSSYIALLKLHQWQHRLNLMVATTLAKLTTLLKLHQWQHCSNRWWLKHPKTFHPSG